jgi:hypothetical protein
MSRITALLIGTASLIGISTVAEAADLPHDKSGYGDGRNYGPPVVHGPESKVDLGRDEAGYYPPNPAFKTWNNCPPNYTVQDGLCKPYKGR